MWRESEKYAIMEEKQMKYILIEVMEREIATPQFFNTYEEAFEQMCRFMAQALGISYEEFNSAKEEFDNCDTGLTKFSAWTERHGNNFDWAIFEIRDEPECEASLDGEVFCNICGGKVVWKSAISDSCGKPIYLKSSEYLDNWDTCRSCMSEHCTTTNCPECKIGKYPDCRFLYLKGELKC